MKKQTDYFVYVGVYASLCDRSVPLTISIIRSCFHFLFFPEFQLFSLNFARYGRHNSKFFSSRKTDYII